VASAPPSPLAHGSESLAERCGLRLLEEPPPVPGDEDAAPEPAARPLALDLIGFFAPLLVFLGGLAWCVRAVLR
jgi:hypothetical protein